MTKKDTQDARIEKTDGGGHVGGTKYGQQPDAKTASTRDDKGRKARPNDGKPEGSAKP
jgi:hypothetical protein